MKPRLKIALGIALSALTVAATIGLGIGLVTLVDKCEHNKVERRAERQLGSGAVCAEEDDGEMLCIHDGVQYTCVHAVGTNDGAGRSRIACARRWP